MGKLNYSSRRISGSKAGKSISKDLKKRIPTNPGSKSTVTRESHLELDATGRELEDEGLAEFIDDLITCIEYKDEGHAEGLVKITELRLRGNKLTVRSLAKLAEVVRLSAADLRELDLSQNDIRVVSAEDKAAWSAFLGAFKNCFLVRKLDLSGNSLGPAGVELLARAYIKSELDFVEEDAEEVIGAAHQDDGPAGSPSSSSSAQSASRQSGHGRRGQPKERASASKNNGSTHVIPPHELRKYACTRGLRSIPYLIVSDIELSSTAVVHLESMIAMQQSPEHLLSFLPHGKAVTVPEEENGNKGSVIWLPNDGLSTHARRFLEVSESIGRLNHDSSSSDISDFNAISEGSEYGDADAEQKQRDKLKVEYARLSKKVRLEALCKDGIHGAELWSRTLMMHVVSRALLLEDKDRVVESTPESSASEETVATSEVPEQPKESGEEGQQPDTQESLGGGSSLEEVLTASAAQPRTSTIIGGVETNFSSDEDGDANSTGPRHFRWRQSMTPRVLSHQFHRFQQQLEQQAAHIHFANQLATRVGGSVQSVSAQVPVQGPFRPQPANRFTTMNPDTMPMEPMQPAQAQMPFFPLAPLPRLTAINRNPLFRPPTPYVQQNTRRRDNSEGTDSDVDTLPPYEPPEDHSVDTPPPAYETLSRSDDWRVVGLNPIGSERGNVRRAEARGVSTEAVSARRDAPNAVGTNGLFSRTASARHDNGQTEARLSSATQALARIELASRPATVDPFAGRPGYQTRAQAAVQPGRDAFQARYRAMRNAEAAHPFEPRLPTYPNAHLPQHLNPLAMSPASPQVGVTYANAAGRTTPVGGNTGPFQPGSRAFEENFPSLHSNNSPPKAGNDKSEEHVHQESEDQSPKTETSEGDSNDDSNEGSVGKTTQSSPQSKGSRRKSANRRKSAPRSAPKEEWLFGLSMDHWRRIIAEAVDADGILSTAQQNHIIRHAADWDCLKQEISIGGAQSHQQMWKYLETVGCFTYGAL